MKKEYITPEMKIYEMEPQQIMATSGTEAESGLNFADDKIPEDNNEDML